MQFIYDSIVFILTCIIRVFFREISERGSWQIPESGACIFVVAPHANQFVDPLILLNCCKRRVNFMVARKTYDKKFIGLVAKMLVCQDTCPFYIMIEWCSRYSTTRSCSQRDRKSCS